MLHSPHLAKLINLTGVYQKWYNSNKMMKRSVYRLFSIERRMDLSQFANG